MARFTFLATTVLALTAVFPAHAAHRTDESCTRDVLRLPRESIVSTDLSLAEREAQIVETHEGVSAPMGSPEIMMARVAPDGKLTIACVQGEEAAQRFLERQVTATPRARNQ